MQLRVLMATAATAAALSLGMSAAFAGGSYGTKTGTAVPVQKDIVDTAAGAGQFNTLAKAIAAAGLTNTLKGPGPYTVFAPTDEAFAKIPADQLNALLADKAALNKVLTFHVVPGNIVAADVKTGPVKTVQGQSLNIDASSSGVKVNDARVIKTDVMATNGVIHVIDKVILPN